MTPEGSFERVRVRWTSRFARAVVLAGLAALGCDRGPTPPDDSSERRGLRMFDPSRQGCSQPNDDQFYFPQGTLVPRGRHPDMDLSFRRAFSEDLTVLGESSLSCGD